MAIFPNKKNISYDPQKMEEASSHFKTGIQDYLDSSDPNQRLDSPAEASAHAQKIDSWLMNVSEESNKKFSRASLRNWQKSFCWLSNAENFSLYKKEGDSAYQYRPDASLASQHITNDLGALL